MSYKWGEQHHVLRLYAAFDRLSAEGLIEVAVEEVVASTDEIPQRTPRRNFVHHLTAPSCRLLSVFGPIVPRELARPVSNVDPPAMFVDFALLRHTRWGTRHRWIPSGAPVAPRPTLRPGWLGLPTEPTAGFEDALSGGFQSDRCVDVRGKPVLGGFASDDPGKPK